jgi:hypothetical protein
MIKVRRKIILLIILGLIVFIISGLSILNKSKNRLNGGKNHFSGYGIQLKKENYEINDFTIQIEKNGEFPCDVTFTNNSDKKSEFLLILYLNYDKIPFSANNQSYSNEYKFDLKANDSITIPILFNNKLPFENNSLIVSFVAGVDKHASDLGTVSDFFGINIEYNLNLDGNTNKIKDKFTQLNDNLDCLNINANNNFSGIMINQDFDNIEKFSIPDNKIYSKPGQDVELAIRFGGYSGINNYLIWLNINYEQCLINNSEKYLLMKNQQSSLQYKKITFKAPIEKRKYELWAFLEKNPLNFQNNSRHSLDYSHRITLIVR